MDSTLKATLKEQLATKKDQLVARIEALEKDKKRENTQISSDSEDRAQEVENDEVVDRLEAIEIKELSEIDLALSKLNTDQFGLCIECGNEISQARMLAVPHAQECIGCASI